MIERVPGALRAGEASSMGNNCTGMNAPSHNAAEVMETATPVNVILCRLIFSGGGRGGCTFTMYSVNNNNNNGCFVTKCVTVYDLGSLLV